MKIHHAVGLLIFIVFSRLLLRDIFSATSSATVSVLKVMETAGEVVSRRLEGR